MKNLKNYLILIFSFILFFEIIGLVLNYNQIGFSWFFRIFGISLIPSIINAIIVVYLNQKFMRKNKIEIILFWVIYGIFIFFLFIIPILILILFI